MTTITWLMISGIILAILKIFGFLFWLWWLDEKSKHIYKLWKNEWNKEILKKLFLSLLIEIALSVCLYLSLYEIKKVSVSLYNDLVDWLTTSLTIAFVSLYTWSIIKFGIKIYLKYSD